jgi:predicted Zn-dependent protease with MMP-like domain
MQHATDMSENLLDQAEDALEYGDPNVALELCSEVLQRSPDHPGATFLWAEATRDLGDLQQAEAGYRRAVTLTPEHSASWSALAGVLFDTLRFAESGACVQRAIRFDACNPEAYYIRALIRERRQDKAGTLRDYIRAERLDPLRYPRPVELSNAMVEAIVVDALKALESPLRAYLGQVAILLEDVPDIATCMQYFPPAAPSELLGYFAGTSLQERSLDNPWSNLPGAIVLFRHNLERLASDRERLIDELRVTVFHEIGHALGLSEDDLKARGLE